MKSKNQLKIVVGIETSCDDTAVALYDLNNQELIADLKISSAQKQAEYGGVVPELAAREHEHQIHYLFDQLVKDNKLNFDDIAYFAYTKQPGLQSCLLVGTLFAQTWAKLLNKPAYEINHIYGHIFSVGLTNKIIFPYLALVASGKTTSLYLVKSWTEVELLNQTSDDAIGEAYDKVGRIMGLDYPCGPLIDKLADKQLKFEPLAQQSPGFKPFSFSGIKTAALTAWNKDNEPDLEKKQVKLATMFQSWIIKNVVKKIEYYVNLYNVYNVAIVGGVAANSWLRKALSNKYHMMLVDLKYATDNAAMIAYYAANIEKNKG